MTNDQADSMAAHLVVLFAAVEAIAATCHDPVEALAYFDHMLEQAIADLLPRPAPDAVIARAEEHAERFRALLRTVDKARRLPDAGT